VKSSRFDRLTRAFAGALSRRGLVQALAVVPALGLALPGEDEDAIAGRRRRRKIRHRRRKNDSKGKGRRKDCKAETTARTCAGRCGTVRNNCRKKVVCDPCVCEPECPVCQICNGSNGQCGPDPEQLGTGCSESNEVCHGDGSCEACDVCASGCEFQSVQDAIDAASNGEVIHLCAGDFSETITIDKNVILIGAGNGAGAGNTTLNGNENGSVVTIGVGPTVTLQTLRIDSGDSINGGGVFNQGTLNLNGCIVTGCGADQGGGIYNTGSLILNQSSIEGNFATNNEGGGIFNGNGGDLEMNDSQISGNVAGRAGGGLFNDSARATLNNSTITNNTANGEGGNPGEGGGIYNEIGTITLNSGSSVTGNNPDNCAGETVAGCSS
jgi:hypothetical protein